MKNINKFLGGVTMALMLALSITTLGAVPFQYAFGGTMAAAVTLTVINTYSTPQADGSLAYAGLLTELWTGELLKAFRSEKGWMSELKNESSYVGNDVIHLTDIGADPAVLIDNTTYPIATAGRTDSDVVFTLNKFDTENTTVTDDELYALTTDKIASVIEQHKEALIEVTAEYGLYNLCVSGNTADTPVLETTGTLNGGVRDLVIADLIAYKKRLDDINIPKIGRVIILSTKHANDLLKVDQVFRDRYANTVTGEVIDFMGFKFYESVQTPLFDALVKEAFGGSPVDPREVSVGIYAPRAFRAEGTVSMYHAKSEEDPLNRESVIGFRTRSLMAAKKNKGFGAIIDGIA